MAFALETGYLFEMGLAGGMAKAPILVVDDEEDVLQVIQEFLKESGYSVVTARDLSGALAKIASNDLQTVISDLLLGGGSFGWNRSPS